MSSKVNILFPIETINRELDFRLLLAALCADDSKRIFIGESNAIFELTGQIKGGLYVGKNVRPTPTPEEADNNQRYRQFNNSGIKLVWLDEEGGIFWGQQDEWKWTMLQSIDPSHLAGGDRVCTWGDVQRDYYRSIAPEKCEQIQTTGHPRFDLYKPHYRAYYAEDVKRLHEQFGDFVLINTNFHRAYTVQNLKKIFGTRSQLDPTGFDHSEAVERWHHLIHIFSDFVKLVSCLRQEFPQLNFIIRPHPSENMRFYKNIFDGIQNVHVLHEGAVGPWLLASRAMIHDGCTTAIESHFCNTPIINYKPLADERFDCMLPNQFGVRCTNETQVTEYLHSLLKLSGDTKVNPQDNTAASETAASLIANFRHNAFPLLAQTIHEAAQQAPQDSQDLTRRLMAKQQSKNRLRTLQTRWRRNKSRRAKSEDSSGMMAKFYGFDNVDLVAKVHAVQTLLQKEVRVSEISNELLCIEAPTG